MPCDTRTLPTQTLAERKAEVRAAIAAFDALLKKRKVKVTVGPQGAIAFAGAETALKGGRISDACAYRLIMATGSALARSEIARAEQLAGRGVDRKVVAQGIHSHDGVTWHGKG